MPLQFDAPSQVTEVSGCEVRGQSSCWEAGRLGCLGSASGAAAHWAPWASPGLNFPSAFCRVETGLLSVQRSLKFWAMEMPAVGVFLRSVSRGRCGTALGTPRRKGQAWLQQGERFLAQFPWHWAGRVRASIHLGNGRCADTGGSGGV